MKMKKIIKSVASHLEISRKHVRPVDGFPGYFVTDCGKVISCLWGAPHRIKSHKVNSGYNAVLLRKDGKSHNVYVHHLVLKNFHGEGPDGYRIHFRDRNRDNMALDNLEWRPSTARAWAQHYESDHPYIPDDIVQKVIRLSRDKKIKTLRRVLADLRRH